MQFPRVHPASRPVRARCRKSHRSLADRRALRRWSCLIGRGTVATDPSRQPGSAWSGPCRVEQTPGAGPVPCRGGASRLECRCPPGNSGRWPRLVMSGQTHGSDPSTPPSRPAPKLEIIGGRERGSKGLTSPAFRAPAADAARPGTVATPPIQSSDMPWSSRPSSAPPHSSSSGRRH